MKLLQLRITCVLCFIGYMCCSQSESTGSILKIGDPAPSLQAGQWVKGEPITIFEKGKIYIVDFGFIGCVPCMEGWPKLSELQKQYTKATFIVVITYSSVSRVRKYLEKMGDRMNLNVAVDFNEPVESHNWVLDSLWVKAAGKGLGKNSMPYPAIFFVNEKGNIAYIGDGTTNIEYQLDSLLGKKVSKEVLSAHQRREYKRQELFNGYLEHARNYPYSEDPKYIDVQYALKCMEELITLFPDNIEYKGHKFELLLKMKNSQAAYNYGKKILESYPWEKMNNAYVLVKNLVPLMRNEFFTGHHPDYDLAIAMCLKSAELSNDDLLTAVSYDNASEFYFMKGESVKGEEFMLKAINLHPDPEDKNNCKIVLEKRKEINYLEIFEKYRKLNNHSPKKKN